jgi:hypothetical protein
MERETKEPAMIVMFLMEKLISVETREWSTKESDKFAIWETWVNAVLNGFQCRECETILLIDLIDYNTNCGTEVIADHYFFPSLSPLFALTAHTDEFWKNVFDLPRVIETLSLSWSFLFSILIIAQHLNNLLTNLVTYE